MKRREILKYKAPGCKSLFSGPLAEIPSNLGGNFPAELLAIKTKKLNNTNAMDDMIRMPIMRRTMMDNKNVASPISMKNRPSQTIT